MQIRLFLKRGLLFSLPLVLWIVLVVVVDPFDYFNLTHVIPEQVKVDNAATLNKIMFTMLKAEHEPSENVIIGDSRIEDLSLEEIDQVSGEKYCRLSSNALKLNEALDLFWFANRLKPLKRVVFGINFNQYNEYAYADREHSVENMVRNPFLYIFDRSVAEAGYFVTKAALTKSNVVFSTPPMTRDEFWNYIANVRAREHYGRYHHPDAVYVRMKEMVAFANEHGIKVTFIIVPHHADFQRHVRDYGLIDEYLRFKHEMSSLGVCVVDYDYLNDITVEKSNFRDPLHSNEAVGNMIVKEVFSGKLAHGKLMDSRWAKECAKYLF